MCPRARTGESHSANPCSGSTLSETACFPQYWPFRKNSRQMAVNPKRADLEVERFGSPNRTRTYDLLVDGGETGRTHRCKSTSKLSKIAQTRLMASLTLNDRSHIMSIPGPAFCAEKQRLLGEFTIAASDYLKATSQQLKSVALGAGSGFEVEIESAAKRKDEAKRAVLDHENEHGC
jgi:hypothetical protein